MLYLDCSLLLASSLLGLQQPRPARGPVPAALCGVAQRDQAVQIRRRFRGLYAPHTPRSVSSRVQDTRA
eukprot:2136691-Rhodomonas_salina.1